LEASDLVIVHRATSSGSFSGDATAQWNNLEVPLWLGSSFLAREPNWSWTSGVQATATEQTGLTVDAPAHPIFAGLSGELFNRPIDINRLSNLDVGNGVLLAHVGDGMAAAAWEAAGLFRDAGTQTHQQRRVFFPIMRYHEDPAAQAGRFPDYSNNGLRLLANVVEYTMTGAVTWPPPIGLPVLGISIGAEGRIILDWTAPGFRLQSSDAVTGPWEDVEGGTEPPVEIMPAEAMQFFQLAQ
jgi:hypothetical protein